MGDYIKENGTFDLLRKLNLDKVYKLILLNSMISKTGIAEKAELNMVTVSNCANILIDKGVVEKIGLSSSKGGRPRETLALKKNFGIFISLEINYIVGRILIMDLQGQIFERGILPDVQNHPEQFLDYVAEKVNWYKKNYPYMEFGIAGLSVILPINYNKNTGQVEFIYSLPHWNGFGILEALKTRIPEVPVFVLQACEAAALGEIHFGASNPMKHMVCLMGALGISMSLYAQGKIYSGQDGFAGRIGHTIVDVNGRQCVCGNHGCLEAYAAIRPIIEQMHLPSEDFYENIQIILEKKREGDLVLKGILEEVVRYLAIGIVNVVNLYNVEEICISSYLGTLLEGESLEQLRGMVDQLLQSHYKRNLRIYCSRLGSFAAVYGGISLIRDELVEIISTYDKNNDK